jgi:Protein of unknown function (DUF4246)
MTLSPLVDKAMRFTRIDYTEVKYDPDPDSLPKEKQPQQEQGEHEDDFWERRQEWLEQYRREHLVFPEPDKFMPPLWENKLEKLSSQVKPGIDLRELYSEKGLQIIVKLASIHLTPEKPSYAGGTWHVEGQLVSVLLFLT